MFRDIYPGAPKILFIGWPNSPHTHAWINLLENTSINVRLFGLPTMPPDDWPVPTYLTVETIGNDSQFRCYPFRAFLGHKIIRKFFTNFTKVQFKMSIFNQALSKVINNWQPQIVHTMGFDSASYRFLEVRNISKYKPIWIAQARGGPDLYLYRHDAGYLANIKTVIKNCDYFIADNAWNYEFAASLGLKDRQLTPLGIISGTGGMDIEGLRSLWTKLPSQRERVIYMPKAYDNQAVKGLSALEALKIAWPHIQPCKVEMAWVTQPEMRMWIPALLGKEIMKQVNVNYLLPHKQSLEHTARARVSFAPSVLDGVPNSMLEAMACGAFPIISPLEGVEGIVENEKHVLFARNLYPQEMADALIRAMNEDALVDQAAANNLLRIKELSDRERNRKAVVDFYQSLC